MQESLSNNEKSTENKEALPKHLSYFVSNLPQEGFRESSTKLPTVDMSNIDEKVKEHIALGKGNYLDITKYAEGYRFTFRFLTSAKDSYRKGGHAGIDLYFKDFIPKPLTLVTSIQDALEGFKKANYESTPLPDGRLIISKNDFKSIQAPVIRLSTEDSKEIPDVVDNGNKWFVGIFNQELENKSQ